MKIKSKLKTVDIPHPNDPSFVVTVKRLGTSAAFAFFGDLQTHQVALAVQGPDGQVLKDDDGRAVVHVKQNFPIEKIFGSMADIIESWRGLRVEDESGAEVEVPYSSDSISYLFEDDLMVETVKVVDDKSIPVSTPYWQWLLEQVRKPETFDRDPKAKR